jgi:hypothetical protein
MVMICQTFLLAGRKHKKPWPCLRPLSGSFNLMKIVIRAFAMPVVVLIMVSSLVFGQVMAGLNPCDLFTKAEAEALFKESVSEGKTGKTSMPAGVSGRYTYQKKAGTYGLTIKVSSLEAIRQEKLFDSPKDYFTRQKKARLATDNAAKKLKVLPGLGDDAFWNGFDLWILKGNYFSGYDITPPFWISLVPRVYDVGDYQRSGM